MSKKFLFSSLLGLCLGVTPLMAKKSIKSMVLPQGSYLQSCNPCDWNELTRKLSCTCVKQDTGYPEEIILPENWHQICKDIAFNSSLEQGLECIPNSPSSKAKNGL